MHSIRDDTIGGFNEFVERQKEAPGKTRMTLIQFNHKYQPIYSRKKIKDVEPLTLETYVPDGNTALLDAIGKAVSDGLKDTAHKADRTICAILTDGHENSSTEYTRDAVRALIEDCQDRHNWTYFFLGADMDAYDEAGSIGIKREFITAYDPTSEGTKKAFKAVGAMAFTASTKGDEDDWETTLDDEYAKS
jgi:hypothetical protein